jgi:hypothetical protein
MWLYRLLPFLTFAVAKDAVSTSYSATGAYASSTVTGTTISAVTHTVDVAKASREVFESQSLADHVVQGGFTFVPDVTLANVGDYVGTVYLIY